MSSVRGTMLDVQFNGTKDEADTGSGEDDWEPPTTCNVRFIGDNIVINGKSNLRKEPKQQKLRIQFNDEATTMFEYPSEESFNEEIRSPTQQSHITPPPTPLVGSTLSSYTPSKSGAQSSFELGVTRSTTTASTPTTAQQFDSQSSSGAESVEAPDYFKPVDVNSETTWSQENTSDMLF